MQPKFPQKRIWLEPVNKKGAFFPFKSLIFSWLFFSRVFSNELRQNGSCQSLRDIKPQFYLLVLSMYLFVQMFEQRCEVCYLSKTGVTRPWTHLPQCYVLSYFGYKSDFYWKFWHLSILLLFSVSLSVTLCSFAADSLDQITLEKYFYFFYLTWTSLVEWRLNK